MFSELASKGGALFDENLRQFRERVSPPKTTSASQERTILALSVAAASASTKSSNLKPLRMPRAWFKNQRFCTTEMILIRSANSRRKFEPPSREQLSTRIILFKSCKEDCSANVNSMSLRYRVVE